MACLPNYIIVLTIFLSLSLAENQQCHPTPSCFCQNSNYGEFEYQCNCKPQNDDCNDAFYLRLKPREEIRISCNSVEEWTSIVKELNVSGLFRKMTLYNCTLPKSSFTQMLQDCGIVGVSELQLDFMKNINSALRKDYFNGLTSLKSLYIQHSSLQSLPDGVFQGLVNLERLLLDNNQLKTLNADIFKSLSQLWYLELGRNNLTHLPGGTFKHVPSLTLLNAYSNHLTSLTRDVFADVPKLKYLDVQSNSIQTIDDDVFVNLPALTDVNLSFNNISYLSQGIFANKTSLSRIRATQAQGTNVTALPENIFFNLTALRTLKLDYNKMEYLPSNLFYQNQNLTYLTLRNNKMISLGENVFKDTPNLVELDLSHNNLTSLNATIFNNMTKLAHLYLEYNQLEFLHPTVFQSLTSLNRLYMSHNHLKSLEPQLFSSLIHLKTINLSYNQVNMSSGLEDSSILNNCKEIESIDLSHNNVTKIFRDWLIIFVYLKDLDLSYNQIDRLSYGDLDFISASVTVNLSNNNITEVNLKFGQLLGVSTSPPRSRNILLDNNPIICDCRAFDLARHIKRKTEITDLTLSAPHLLCSAPAHLANKPIATVKLHDLTCLLSKIQTPDDDFDFSQFCPANCSCFFRPVDNAVIFNCDGAMLRNMPPPPPAHKFAFNHTELLVSNNHLTSVKMLQPWLKQINITRLSLASNNLLMRDLEDLIIPSSLKILELHDNKLSNLDKDTIERLNHSSSLTNVTLYQNPWKCDCELSDLVSFLRTRYKKVNLLNNVTCANNGKPLVELSFEELCHFSITIIIISVSLASFGLLFGTLIILYYRYENQIKVWLFSHKICLWLVTEKEMDRDKLYDAFVSYSHLDEPFVVEELVPQLENGENPFKLCIHIRDWPIGGYIPHQIVKSVESSRRTIIILSPNFLTSSWGQVEFREAYLKMVKERCPRVIIILLKDIGDTNKLYPELKAYLTMNTYLKWGDPWFWQKLRYAMPHPQKQPKHESFTASNNFLSPGLLQMNKLNNNMATIPSSYFEPCKEKKIDETSVTKVNS